ncbi:MAG: DUF6351 family protein, partial [Steroidobacteraceae bacterium]
MTRSNLHTAFNGRSMGKHPWYVAMMISGFAVLGLTPTAAAAGPEIIVLSNRADLVSGGDALVEIKVPPYVDPSRGAKIDVDGRNVNAAFAIRPDGRYYGL